MWNALSVFITILQGIMGFIKFIMSFFITNRRTYKEFYREIEFSHLKKKFRNLKRDKYNYKYIKGAKLLFILKDYFSIEKAKDFISACKRDGYISYNKCFDIDEIVIIRKEDEFIEKIINSCKS